MPSLDNPIYSSSPRTMRTKAEMNGKTQTDVLMGDREVMVNEFGSGEFGRTKCKRLMSKG